MALDLFASVLLWKHCCKLLPQQTGIATLYLSFISHASAAAKSFDSKTINAIAKLSQKIELQIMKTRVQKSVVQYITEVTRI